MRRPEESIQLQYRLGPSDLVRALELHTACPGLIAMMSWAVTAGALSLVAQRNGGSPWLVQGLIVLAGVLCLAVVTAPACAAWRWHHARGFFSPRELTADERGVEVAGGRGSVSLPWEAIPRWRESSQQFLLYESDGEFVVVPKHAFGSLAQIDAFKAALEARVGPPGAAGA